MPYKRGPTGGLAQCPPPENGLTGRQSMSARNVGTMCNGRQWQCEVEVGKNRCEQCMKWDQRHPEQTSLPCLACTGLRHARDNTEQFRDAMEVFAPYWHAQNRSVLAVKWACVGPHMPMRSRTVRYNFRFSSEAVQYLYTQ